MPIHNQENIIVKNLNSILETVQGLYEIILILDCCSDSTVERVLAWAKNISAPGANLISLKIYESDYPLFEATADNFGFKVSQGKYILEIQADMTMTQKGFNEILVKPFLLLPSVIGVSGRCAHNLQETRGVGRMSYAIERPTDRSTWSDKIFYIEETCNRGPLMLDREKLVQLNYLDDIHFVQDNSDHDLFARAWHFHKWICGYVPIDFDAPLADGTNRKPKNELNARAFKERNAKAAETESFLQKYMRELYKPHFDNKTLLFNLS
jgi:glycosyltransferase involved in cell wall biosynthesis